MHGKLITLIIISTLLLGCKSVSQEEAIQITQDFVNKQVKFYVSEDNETPIVSRASITILNTVKQNDEWQVYLNIKSDLDNETKQSNLLVTVDAKKGEVKEMLKIQG